MKTNARLSHVEIPDDSPNPVNAPLDLIKATFIIGCTASGKGTLARELARRTGGEIVSIDSMKVYRRMDIGTAKPPASTRQEVPCHVIDVVEPWEDFSVAEYLPLAQKAIADIDARNKPVFVVGGTALYIKALTEGLFEGPGADLNLRSSLEDVAREFGTAALHEQLKGIDPAASERIHPNDLRRLVRALEVHQLTGRPISHLQEQWDRQPPRYDCTFIGLRWSREDQARRINERVRRMIAAGLVEEVRSIVALPRPMSIAARQAVGYAEIIQHLSGDLDLEKATEQIKINTRQLAKSQRTWFKRFRNVQWIEMTDQSDMQSIADDLIKKYGAIWSPSLK